MENQRWRCSSLGPLFVVENILWCNTKCITIANFMHGRLIVCGCERIESSASLRNLRWGIELLSYIYKLELETAFSFVPLYFNNRSQQLNTRRRACIWHHESSMRILRVLKLYSRTLNLKLTMIYYNWLFFSETTKPK